MFTSFTGKPRRPRQVNLSGRNASNPFAATSSAGGLRGPGGSGGPGGASSALEHAQLERKARKSERDRLHAARVIQRTWRGYYDRRKLREQCRQQLQKSEDHLAGRAPSEVTCREVQEHVRLCVYTVLPSPRGDDEWAGERLLRSGRWICDKATEVSEILATESDNHRGWTSTLRSFSRVVEGHLMLALYHRLHRREEEEDTAEDTMDLDHSTPAPIANAGTEPAEDPLQNQSRMLLSQLGCVIALLDTSTHTDWATAGRVRTEVSRGIQHGQEVSLLEAYYVIVSRFCRLRWLLTVDAENDTLDRLIRDKISIYHNLKPLSLVFAAPVLSLTGRKGHVKQTQVYDAILVGFLIASNPQQDSLKALGMLLNGSSFYCQIQTSLEQQDRRLTIGKYQNILQNLLHMSSPEHAGAASKSSLLSLGTDFLSFLSFVLDVFPSVDDLSETAVRDLRALTSADAIAELVQRSNLLNAGLKGQAREADILSDFILNILRLLPQQADEIRMRLYISHEFHKPETRSSSKSAVRFFWDATLETPLFKRAVRSWTEARSLLSDLSGAHRADWKVIVMFMEIYTIALRIQDDDQFVEGLNQDTASFSSSSSTLASIEVQMLLEFLKNISYCLYLKAPLHQSSQDEREKPESASSMAAARSERSLELRARSANGVNFQLMKESVTSLMRMIYERDSRRKFLPAGSFLLLTDETEPQQFVTNAFKETVVKEIMDEEDSDDDDAMILTDPDNFSGPREHDRGVITSQHTQRVARQELRERQLRLLAKRRARQQAVPRVELLENIPFLIPFKTRVQIFRMHVDSDMTVRRGGDPDPDRWRMRLINRSGLYQAELNRESIFEDAFNAFDWLGEGLKEPIRISFVGEEGIDGGGVTKEFLTSVINDVFRVDSPYRLFVENDDHKLYPNPSVLEETDAEVDALTAIGEQVTAQERQQRRRRVLEYYRFAGRLVGKCLYEGVLVNIPLARFFVAKWALTGGFGAARNETTYRPSLHDMWDYDKAIYRSLLNLQRSVDDVSTWGLTYAVDETVAGKQIQYELRPGGAETAVNNSNRLDYRFRLVNYYLVVRQYQQTRAFLDGLSSIIKPTWLRMFNETEIQVLLGGESRPINVEDLRRNTVYSGVYAIGDDGKEHDTISMFWAVMHEMEDSDRRKLLQYVTSTPNAPLMGFGHLNPRFCIRDSQSDQGRLPTSSTCANLLKLPIYRDKSTLRNRILTAIHSKAGFDLS